MDLSKVTFPTFVLEPRSMLERITDFMSHPDLIFGYVPFHPHDLLRSYVLKRHNWDSAENCDDPEERFIRVLQYYLAGWHIKPKGVKKPYVAFTLSFSIRIASMFIPCLILLDSVIIPSWANSSDADTTTQTVHKVSTSPNKVSRAFPSPTNCMGARETARTEHCGVLTLQPSGFT